MVSLGLAFLDGGIVEEGQVLHEELGVVVEEHRRTRLPLEAHIQEVIPLRHDEDVNLDLSALDSWLELSLHLLAFFALFVLRLLVDLLLDFEVDAEHLPRDGEGLAKIAHFLHQVRQNLLRGQRAEEAMGLVEALLVGFQLEEHRRGVVSLGVRQLGVLRPAVVHVCNHAAAGLPLDMGLHRLLLLVFLSCDLLVFILTRCELLADGLGSGKLTPLEPRVSNDIGDGEPLVRVEVEHGSDQVLEVGGEEAIGFAVLVGGPKLLRTVRGDVLVVWVFHVGHVEGWVARVEHEQDHPEGKQVHDLALVRLVSMDFRSHEAERADNRAIDTVSCAAFHRASEAEVDHLDIVELVEKNVLTLEVSVREPFRVDVMDGLDQLLGVVPHHWLAEGARVGHIVEELSAVDELTGDVGDSHLLARLLRHDCVLVKLEVLDDVLMVEVLNR